MTEAQVDIVLAFEAALISTLVQNPAQVSQDIHTTPTTANALLLLTTSPKFDRTTTEDIFESTKSSAAHTRS